MFTTEELQALYNIINRVNFNGSEAKTVVLLQTKIEGLLNEQGGGNKPSSNNGTSEKPEQ